MSKMKELRRMLTFLFAKESLQLLAVTASSALLAAIVIFARITYLAIDHSLAHQPLPDLLKVDASTAIAILRVLQSTLSTISSAALVKSFTYLYWIMIGRPNGFSLMSLLALAPSTIETGRLRLVFGLSTKLTPRVLALSRYDGPKTWRRRYDEVGLATSADGRTTACSLFATTLLWVSGLVLFLRTSMVTVYDTTYSYEAVAGVGQFNASLVDSFLSHIDSSASGYEYQVLPYSYYSVVYNLVTNPVFSSVHEPVSCKGTGCTSYVLSGGVIMSATWQHVGYQEYPLVQLPSVPVMQLDFDNRPTGRNYTDMADCNLFGDDFSRIGVRFCLAPSRRHSDAVEAGIFICSGSVVDGTCVTQYPTPNLTTTMSFHSRNADILASRSNSSVLSVSNLSAPRPVRVGDDLQEYSKALRWLLDYSAADIPAPSSIIESFWTGRGRLETEHLSYGYLAQHFHSILAFPLWFFNANNYGNVNLPSSLDVASPLPSIFLTEAHIVAAYSMIKLDTAMIIIFAAAQGLILVFVWLTFLVAAVCSASLPRVSSFPLFDVIFKAQANVGRGPEELWDADDGKIGSMAKESRVRRKME